MKAGEEAGKAADEAGKQTSSNAEASARVAATKMKRNACEGCYRSRVKCEYKESDPTKCVRCKRQNRECIPRSVHRAKRGEGDKLNLNALDLEAYKSSRIFEDLPHLSLHLSAAASLVRTYKSLGLLKPPLSLQWTINSMYLIAATEKSVGLLHTSTTLAVSANTQIDVNMLNENHCPLSEKQKAVIENEVHSEFLNNSKAGACYILRIDGGDRAIMANAEWEYFFEDAKGMASRISRSPHFKLWRKFILEENEADTFTSQMVKSWLTAGEPVGNPGVIRWGCVNKSTVRIRDNKGHLYNATMVEHGFLAGQGFLNFLVFGFKDLKPLSTEGEERKKQFGVEFPANSMRKPSLSRLDSVLSMLLPEPTTGGLGGAKHSFTGNVGGDNSQGIAPLTGSQLGSFNEDDETTGVDTTVPMARPPRGLSHKVSSGDALANSGGNMFPMRPQSLISLLDTSTGSQSNTRGLSSTSTGMPAPSAPAGVASAGSDQQSQGRAGSFQWPASGLVSLDNEEVWNNMDKVINDLGGQDKVSKEWGV